MQEVGTKDTNDGEAMAEKQETAGLTRDGISKLAGITPLCSADKIPDKRLSKGLYTSLAISFHNAVFADCPPSDLDVVVVEEISEELLEEVPKKPLEESNRLPLSYY